MYRGLYRYIIFQILGPFSLATLVLVGIIWLTQALRLLDVIIDQEQSAATYIALTALTLPGVLAIVLPISFFLGTLYVIHRLYTDNELVVMFSAGVSRWGIAIPILSLSTLVCLLVFCLNFYGSPAGLRKLKSHIYDIRADFAIAMIQEGRFNNPFRGLTVYVRNHSGNGQIQGILVHDNRDPDYPVTYMAESGRLMTSGTGPRLLMFNGNVQQVRKSETEKPSISFLYFDKYTYDLTYILGDHQQRYYEPRERFHTELASPSPDDFYAKTHRNQLIAELHERIVTVFYPLIFATLAIAALISAEFNRRGYVIRIATALCLALVIRLLSLAILNQVVKTPTLLPLHYLFPAAVIAVCIASISGIRLRTIIDQTSHRFARITAYFKPV